MPISKPETTSDGSSSGQEAPKPVFETDWLIDKYRNPHDTFYLWELKNLFMQLHKKRIPEHELVPLAHVFANMVAYGCKYTPKLMERVKELGGSVYRKLEKKRTYRTLAPKDTLLYDTVKQEELNSETCLQLSRLSPIFPAQSLVEIFQNIVVVNNSLKETTEWFERLGSGTISIAIGLIAYGVYEVKAYVSNYFITRASGTYQIAYAQCVADLLEILKNYCYQVNYVQRFSYLNYNVERLLDDCTHQPTQCYQQYNIGYRLLQKLGWTGGALGSKQTGILEPIEVSGKFDRRGLGARVTVKKNRIKRVIESECTIDEHFYRVLMEAILVRKPYYDLIFSPEFTEYERILLTRLAVERRLRCETRLSETGQAQFVIKRYPLPPHVVLTNVLVYDDPLVSKYYEVKAPKVLNTD
ncbi:uncharacterized protein LOC128298050 [Anopheles moucheti]|uniref:uncharacterized protein LOC128298050 n=1 Tax=Anopheles moucheti TaxID=186751 RepID=UPI0022F0D37C|nr:uncharacterized protein LOC128298050 [Anopheles moucheti]XP_052889742.1 uncharacterized protein LOC128298050 [Anopheles moucheti]